MEHSELLAFAHRLADASAPHLAQAFRHSTTTATLKNDRSPVTQADRAVEEILRAMIMAHYPDHGIIGEEYGNHQPEAAYQWVIDPIDGTRAFTCGIPSFGTLIGLMHHSHMLIGMLNQPITGERWVGVKGEHTRMRCANGEETTLTTSTCQLLSHARLATTSPYLFAPHHIPVFGRLRDATAIQNYGGDCYNYGMLAAGYVDVVVEAGLKLYDILPLLPILQGAGAIVTDWHGNPLDFSNSTLDILAVANHALHRSALMIMKG